MQVRKYGYVPETMNSMWLWHWDAEGDGTRHPTPALLPGKSHGRRSLVGCSPWAREESDMTERLPFHFSLSCIGEGNGNPLQCSCLENPRDGGAWWLPSMGSHRVGHDWSDLAAMTLRTGATVEEKTGEGEECRMVIYIHNVSKVVIFFLGHEETLGIFKWTRDIIRYLCFRKVYYRKMQEILEETK